MKIKLSVSVCAEFFASNGAGSQTFGGGFNQQQTTGSGPLSFDPSTTGTGPVSAGPTGAGPAANGMKK